MISSSSWRRTAFTSRSRWRARHAWLGFALRTRWLTGSCSASTPGAQLRAGGTGLRSVSGTVRRFWALQLKHSRRIKLRRLLQPQVLQASRRSWAASSAAPLPWPQPLRLAPAAPPSTPAPHRQTSPASCASVTGSSAAYISSFPAWIADSSTIIPSPMVPEQRRPAHVAVMRKIPSETERARFRSTLPDARPPLFQAVSARNARSYN